MNDDPPTWPFNWLCNRCGHGYDHHHDGACERAGCTCDGYRHPKRKKAT